MATLEQERVRFLEMLGATPQPSLADFFEYVYFPNFTEFEKIIAVHPGAKIWSLLESVDDSFRILLACLDNQNAAYGTFQGAADAHTFFQHGSWESATQSFTQSLFLFCAAARAIDEMLQTLGNKRFARGKALVDQARSEAIKDADLVDFVHQLRDHLLHVRIERPDPSLEGIGPANAMVARVKLSLNDTGTDRWRGGARNYLSRNTKVDIMSVAQGYVRQYQNLKKILWKSFYKTLTAEERHYSDLRSYVQERAKMMMWGIHVQTVQQRPNMHLLAFLPELDLTPHQIALIRSKSDYSEEQFELLRRILDPADLCEKQLLERLKAEFLARASRSLE